MSDQALVTVRMLGFLHVHCTDRGEPPSVRVDVPQGGVSARTLAESLGLPLDRIDGEFINHRSADLDSVVFPGDRVAFVPVGTPASHPAFFGRFCEHEGGAR